MDTNGLLLKQRLPIGVIPSFKRAKLEWERLVRSEDSRPFAVCVYEGPMRNGLPHRSPWVAVAVAKAAWRRRAGLKIQKSPV